MCCNSEVRSAYLSSDNASEKQEFLFRDKLSGEILVSPPPIKINYLLWYSGIHLKVVHLQTKCLWWLCGRTSVSARCTVCVCACGGGCISVMWRGRYEWEGPGLPLFTYRAYPVPAGRWCAVWLGESKQASHRFQSSLRVSASLRAQWQMWGVMHCTEPYESFYVL